MEDRTDRNISAALAYIPAEDRNLWIRIGMALKSYYGDFGFEIWNEWSKKSDSYKYRSVVLAWKSFKYNGCLGIGSVFYEAKRYGFRCGK